MTPGRSGRWQTVRFEQFARSRARLAIELTASNPLTRIRLAVDSSLGGTSPLNGEEGLDVRFSFARIPRGP
jgi:hypothetical protein